MAKQQRKDITFGGLSNNMDESIESEANSWASMNTWHDKGLLEGIRRYKQIGQRSSPNSADVALGLGYGKATSNEIQRFLVTGAPTGGTVKLTIVISGNTYSDAGTLAWNATADDMYAYLQTLDNAGTVAFRPGDLNVTGGPWPGNPIEVEFTGRYIETDMAMFVLATNSLTGGSSPTVTISEKRKGGSAEVYYAVVQPSGSGDATLYAVTSSDDFETTTWTSLATDFDPTDWYFEQFFDKMFMANTVDGLKYVYIGSTALSANPPSPPAMAPTYGGPFDDNGAVNLGTGCSYAQTGFTNAPTMAASGGACKITLTGTETGNTVVVTVTLAAGEDLSTRDYGQLEITSTSGAQISGESMKIHFLNSDGSPATITPAAFSNPVQDQGVSFRHYQLAGVTRYLRENIAKAVITFTITDGENTDVIYLIDRYGSNWMNDTLSLAMGPPPLPVQAPIEYGMTYYRVSDGVESRMSPVSSSHSTPTGYRGNYLSVNGRGSSELGASDQQWFYRKSRGDGQFYRVPNLWTKNGSYQVTDYGVPNDPTGASDGQYDHWMEYELGNFPKYEASGFPPISTGAGADVIGVWKQCLAIGSGKQSYLSWVGQPLRFEPSPDTQGYVSPDPDEFPDVGVTEYVSDNRAEKVYALIGQDSLYAVTPLSAYAKVGDSPATASVFRRLPGSRGTLSKRAVYRYGGGILIGALDGLWYYSVGRGFSGEDNGALVEREETGGSATTGAPGVRRSYQRLLSELQSIQLSGTGLGGTFSLTWNGYTTPEIAVDATPLDVKRALEDLMNSYRALEGFVPNSIDEVEVFGEDLVDADGNGGGIMYVRFMGAYGASNVAAMTGSVTNVTGDNEAITISTVTSGIQTNLIVFEFNDEYWLINQKSWLHQSRSRKWSEGIWTDSIKAIIANRERGIVMLTSDGKLMKIKDGAFGDGLDSTPIPWQYESPWMTGPRAGVLGVSAVVQGSPTFRLYSDDGAGSVDAYGANSPHSMTITLEENKMRTLPASNLPGIRHKIIVSGVTGRDKVKSLALNIQPEGGDGTGS